MGLAIEQRWQIAVLPPSLNQACSVHDGIGLILGSAPCAAMFNGIWSRPDAAYLELQAHAAQVVSAMLGDAEASPIAIAALMSVWRGKTKAVPEALQDDNTAFAFLARHALLTQATVDAEFSARLWQSLFLLTEHERGRKMDEASVLEVVGMVALVAAHSDLINGSVSRESFKTAFVKGLAGEYAELIFIKSYKKWRCDLARNLKADDPPFSRLGNSMLGGTSYRQRWHGSYRSNLSPQPPES